MLSHVRELTTDHPVEVIPMGTNLSTQFVPPIDPTKRDRNHIIFVGRLVEKKGLHSLLEAFASVKGAQPDLRLTVAGDGPLKGALQRQATDLGIAEHVSFLGSVAHADLPKLYQHATLAVFPFVVAGDGDQEGFGLVVVEAMGCGCPVIANDLPALRDSIEAGITGLLAPPDDVVALAGAIRTALADEALRERLADAALVRARERFDWYSIATRYERLIDVLVGKDERRADRPCRLATASEPKSRR